MKGELYAASAGAGVRRAHTCLDDNGCSPLGHMELYPPGFRSRLFMHGGELGSEILHCLAPSELGRNIVGPARLCTAGKESRHTLHPCVPIVLLCFICAEAIPSQDAIDATTILRLSSPFHTRESW